MQPDVILGHTTGVTAILQRETRAIPIVFVNVSDPIGMGFIASLPRPGGNLTGVLHYEATIVGKWLAMLKEIAPRLTRAERRRAAEGCARHRARWHDGRPGGRDLLRAG